MCVPWLTVALRKESVDRNKEDDMELKDTVVALRKESVDRNVPRFEPAAAGAASLSARRAWIEMHFVAFSIAQKVESLSARRAWIEICSSTAGSGHQCVALRKESVDRNNHDQDPVLAAPVSLSARRAWIEISFLFYCWPPTRVALRKESVDRNSAHSRASSSVMGRSPQGERG